MWGDPTLTISGELYPRPDTARICLRGLPLASFSSVGPFRRTNRRVAIDCGGDVVTATLDGTPAGVVLQLNGEDLRQAEHPISLCAQVAEAIRPVWPEMSLPRLDWGAQLRVRQDNLASMLEIAERLGFTATGRNRVLAVMGTEGYSYRRYYEEAVALDGGSRRLCGVDRVELHIYTAHDLTGELYWRAECREFLYSRAVDFSPHEVTSAFFAEICDGVTEVPGVSRLLAPSQPERSARRAVGLLLGCPTVSDDLVKEAFAEVYGLPTLEQLKRSYRLERLFTSVERANSLDISCHPLECFAAACKAAGQSELRRSIDLKPCRV